MAVTPPKRIEHAARFKTFVKRTMVTAMRSVFTDQYPDPEFRNMPVLTEYPVEKIRYPMMIVKFNAGRNMNAGVGHEEMHFDDEGQYRKFFHRRFEGTIEFHMYTLSSLSQDNLSDAVSEVIAFGRLQNLTDQFYQTIFDDYNNGGQLMFQSDVIDDLGVSVGKPFWNPEDQLLYQGGLSVVCHGGFFSTGESELNAFLDGIVIHPYIQGQEDQYVGEIDVPWVPVPPTSEDFSTVRENSVVDGDEDYTSAP